MFKTGYIENLIIRNVFQAASTYIYVYIYLYYIILVEASRGAEAQSVTVKSAGCGFDPHSRK